MKLRSAVTTTQQTFSEAGAELPTPTVVIVAAAVVENPLAGRGHVADLEELEVLGNEAAGFLVRQALGALGALGIEPSDVRGYGKGAIVGINGDREHTAAVLHPRFGAPVRAAIGGGADIIPGTKKVGGVGSSITMPIGNKDDRWVFDDMDAADLSIVDAPRPDEMVIALVLSAGGRPGARVKKPV